jgi:hypothetical protein
MHGSCGDHIVYIFCRDMIWISLDSEILGMWTSYHGGRSIVWRYTIVSREGGKLRWRPEVSACLRSLFDERPRLVVPKTADRFKPNLLLIGHAAAAAPEDHMHGHRFVVCVLACMRARCHEIQQAAPIATKPCTMTVSVNIK